MSRIPVDDVMMVEKSEHRLVAKEESQTIIDRLETGINVISVELSDIVP